MRLFREPALWFLVIGGALFVAHRIAADTAAAADTIVVSPERVDALAARYRAQTGREPDAAALEALVEAWITDEALYREALGRGLHDGDPVVRRRLIQVLEFMAEDAPRPPPSEAELGQWLADHPAAFRQAPRVAVRHVFFGPDEAAAVAALPRLKAGEAPEAVGGRPFVHGLTLDASVDHVQTLLGQRFADAVRAAGEGAWVGPVRSSYGLHLVQVTGRTAGRAPPLAEVRPAVEAAWREAQRQAARQARRDRARAAAKVAGWPR